MVNSMTGFASLQGAHGHKTWGWELRSVNARGLDLRLRLPEGLDDLEQLLRKSLTSKLARGNVSLTLRLQNLASDTGLTLNVAQLDNVLDALRSTEQSAGDKGVHLTASTAAEILSLRGVMDIADASQTDMSPIIAALKAEVDPLVASFVGARADEGRALAGILAAQLDKIRELVAKARVAAVERQARMRDVLKQNLALILDNAENVDEARLSQELALLAVKADVAEELDRLEAHIAGADVLLATKGAVGRKFDFLMQEFNREANTLCSKSGSTDLTSIGLDLKTLIDQMREQVQNVE